MGQLMKGNEMNAIKKTQDGTSWDGHWVTILGENEPHIIGKVIQTKWVSRRGRREILAEILVDGGKLAGTKVLVPVRYLKKRTMLG